MLSPPAWSGDGTRIAVADKNGRLYVMTLADKSVTKIADDRYGFIQDYAWSPDGAHLAFSMAERDGFRALHLWSARDGKLHRVTDRMFNVRAPAWDPEGNYLYVLSEREFAPQISAVEWNFAGNRRTDIFALALRRDVKHPFPPRATK